MHRGICIWIIEDGLCRECGQNTFRRLVFWVGNKPVPIDGYCTNRECNPNYRSIDELRCGESTGFTPILVFEAQLCPLCNRGDAVVVYRGNDFLASECPDCMMGSAPLLDRRAFRLEPPRWSGVGNK